MARFDDNEYIYLSLLHLGAVSWSKSHKRLLHALQYVISHDLITSKPARHLYAELAALENCSYGIIERSLRYAIRGIWECSHVECSKLLYHSRAVARCPSVSDFIFLYARAFKHGAIQEWVDSLEAEEAEPSELDIDDILGLFKL